VGGISTLLPLSTTVAIPAHLLSLDSEFLARPLDYPSSFADGGRLSVTVGPSIFARSQSFGIVN
jgi:hypothetical protein